MALTEKQRRDLDDLYAEVTVASVKLKGIATEAKKVLPPGAMPGMLADAHKSVEHVREILEFMVKHVDLLREDGTWGG